MVKHAPEERMKTVRFCPAAQYKDLIFSRNYFGSRSFSIVSTLINIMKTETLYSRADWKYHKNKLGYDDVINGEGSLVVTISVMDIAVHDLLNADAGDDRPKEIFMLEADGFWAIFIDAIWLTPEKVQAALDRLGKITDRIFAFEPYELPTALKERNEQDRQRYEKEIDEGHATPLDMSELSDWREMDAFKEWENEQEKDRGKTNKAAIPEKRLAAILIHKLKM
jgi:hypothetical protein